MIRPLVILALFVSAVWILTGVQYRPSAENLRRHGAEVREENGVPVEVVITPSKFPREGWQVLRGCKTVQVLRLEEPISATDSATLKEWLPQATITLEGPHAPFGAL